MFGKLWPIMLLILRNPKIKVRSSRLIALLLLVVVGVIITMSLLAYHLVTVRPSRIVVVNMFADPIRLVVDNQEPIELKGFGIWESSQIIIRPIEIRVYQGNETEPSQAISFTEEIDPQLHVLLVGTKQITDNCLVSADVTNQFYEISALHTSKPYTIVDKPNSLFRIPVDQPWEYYVYPGKLLQELPTQINSRQQITGFFPVPCASLNNATEIEKAIKFWISYNPEKQLTAYKAAQAKINADSVYNDPGP
jgi:hypothetical protein